MVRPIWNRSGNESLLPIMGTHYALHFGSENNHWATLRAQYATDCFHSSMLLSWGRDVLPTDSIQPYVMISIHGTGNKELASDS